MNKQQFPDVVVERPTPSSMKSKYTLRPKLFLEASSVTMGGYNSATGIKDLNRFGLNKTIMTENMNLQPLGDLMFNFNYVSTSDKIKDKIKIYDSEDVEKEIRDDKPNTTNQNMNNEPNRPTPEKQLMNENYEKNSEFNSTGKPDMTGKPL